MTQSTATQPNDIEDAVLSRYKQGARQVEPTLCCPITDYDGQYLKVLPDEILEKDYGCGDPSKYVSPGQTVVDLGSGAGKICYILSQKVGASGQVIGVDFNCEMLDLANKYKTQITEKIGYDNVRFAKGRIQDLALSLDRLEDYLKDHPVKNSEDVLAYEAHCQHLRCDEPMIASDSVDVVVSNCVLNLVKTDQKKQLFDEIFRVLKRGGQAVISDIVCDQAPGAAILEDAQLWSGCIAGAFVEDAFLQMFEQAGFHGIEILARATEPWQVIEGIAFRSMTVRAYKGKQGPCLERNQAVVYQGPWKKVIDDDGHTLLRGQRMAVCDKTFQIYTRPDGPYASSIIPIEPKQDIPLENAKPFNCATQALRHPAQTKGQDYHETRPPQGDACCEDASGAGKCC